MRARGRMQRQGQGASALRIRRQADARHHAASLGRRPVHRPRQGAARQSLRRPHSRTVFPAIETQIGASLAHIVADRGYRGHNARPATSSASISLPRDAASPRPSNASCAAVPPSNRSSATRKRSTARAETTSPEPMVTPPTSSSPPPATISAAYSNGWLSCCLILATFTQPPVTRDPSNRPDRVLHSRLKTNERRIAYIDTLKVLRPFRCCCRTRCWRSFWARLLRRLRQGRWLAI